MKRICKSFFLLLLVMFISGCNSSSASNYDSFQLEFEQPPELGAQLHTIPSEPIVGEVTIVRVTLPIESKPSDGMRIELRNNSRETRLYEAEEKMIDNQLIYEIEAVFEKAGENLIVYHCNVANYHVMSSFTIEVKSDEGY